MFKSFLFLIEIDTFFTRTRVYNSVVMVEQSIWIGNSFSIQCVPKCMFTSYGLIVIMLIIIIFTLRILVNMLCEEWRFAANQPLLNEKIADDNLIIITISNVVLGAIKNVIIFHSQVNETLLYVYKSFLIITNFKRV